MYINTHYEILTESGFSDFDGILETKHDSYISISFNDGTSLKTSFDHLLRNDNGSWISAHCVSEGMVFSDKEVLCVSVIDEQITLYDVLDTDGHTYISNGVVSHNCAFHGSSGTLIAGEKLAELVWKEPIIETDTTKVYERPEAGHSYLVTVDVSEGVGGDFSVINVSDITTQPYKQVMVFRSNEISPMVLPEYVERIAKEYNEGFVLVETNSIGAQVSNILWNDYEYENMIVTATKNQENFVSGGFGATSEIGLRITKKSKRIGCTNIKALIENDIYIVNDFTTISELQTFVSKGTSYEAEEGKYDDVVMTLVSLGWLSTQDYFRDLMDVDNRAAVLARQMEAVENDMTPIGIFDDCDVDAMNSDDPEGVIDMGMI